MQPRDSTTTMDTEGANNSSSIPSSRVNRNNSKLKVLVRSHAMREETSPPREPTPNSQHQRHQSPRINLIPSPEIFSSPVVVLSPTKSSSSTCKSPRCLSPASTVVPSSPSNSRSSPTIGASVDDVSTNDRPHTNYSEVEMLISSPKLTNKIHSLKQTSHNSFKKRNSCECQTQNCLKCIKSQGRNINNNLTSVNNNTVENPNSLSISRTNLLNKIQQSASLSSFDNLLNPPCFSIDNTTELYTDTTGVDLEQFIPETLNRNAKDRALMLRIEQELIILASDACRMQLTFPAMSSYNRMLVHRCSAYFGMDHNIDAKGKAVVVRKTPNTRIPEVRFEKHIKKDIIFNEEPRRSILKRDSNSMDDYRSFGCDNRRSKSFEEREEEYEKARRRIFNREMRDESSEDISWSETPWSSTESDFSARYRLQTSEMHHRHHGKLLKGHSEETGETQRPCVAKSYSFGGYCENVSVLNRGDSVMSTHSAGPRFFTKQDSGASCVSWRLLSPSSSGYKSQSQMSESVTPSPTSTPHHSCDVREDSACEGDRQNVDKSDDNRIVWAVSDIQDVPKGSLIINPVTGQPIKNEDGTLYHYDPENLPPTICQTVTKNRSPSPPKTTQHSPKKSHSVKSSPSKKSYLTNSSTSPSLPFSPPSPTPTTTVPQKNFYVQTDQQQYPGYHATYTSPPAVPEPPPVYQQPYIVYSSPYGVYMPQQYDGRLEVPSSVTVSDVGSNAYYVPEGSAPPPVHTQSVAYQPGIQPSQYWNQSMAYYQNNPQSATPTPPRYPSVPMQPQAQPAYISSGYTPTNYIPSPTVQTAPEMQSIYPNQPVQVVYQSQGATPSSMYYQNQQPIIYSQNPVYPSTGATYPSQMAPQQMAPQQTLQSYPQSTPTPNSCLAGTGATLAAVGHDQHTLYNLAQSIQHMNVGSMPCQSYLSTKGPQAQYDFRQRPVSNGLKGKPFKYFLMGSSQSSTGTNSPAGTVIATYCTQNTGIYRTPSETPPHQFTFQPNFAPPTMFKQVPNVRASTPGTSKSSRSPTPANDGTYYDRQKMPPLATNMYQGISYVVPSADPRLMSGRGQPNVYRQPPTQVNRPPNQGTDNRNRNRKSKIIKQTGLPPSGK